MSSGCHACEISVTDPHISYCEDGVVQLVGSVIGHLLEETLKAGFESVFLGQVASIPSDALGRRGVGVGCTQAFETAFELLCGRAGDVD